MQRDPDICVIALVPDQWAGVWGVRHQVLTRLSRHFRVIWVPPVPGWREAWTAPATATDDGAPLPDGMVVLEHSRLYPAFFRPAWLADYMRGKVAAGIMAQARLSGARKIVLYLWRPQFSALLNRIPHDLSLYHIDDEYSFSDTEVPVADEEARLIAAVDRVFIHSPGLLEKKGGINPQTAYIPNGVDYRAYAEAVAEPADLAAIPGPRVGYVGVIKKQLNLELMSELAVMRPDWSFVLVGPVGNVAGKEQWLAKLRASENVHLLGGKPADELPGYVQHLDVCTMAYEANAYTQYIYPLKMHEYLAAGKPVVSTPIRTVRSFGAVVDLVETPEQWLRAIENNLEPGANTPAQTAARQAVARAHDWDKAVAEIVVQIQAGLAG